MEELKACPFCGGTNHPYHKEGCFIINVYYSELDAYNKRPVEDALRARITELEEVLKNYADPENWSNNIVRPYDDVYLFGLHGYTAAEKVLKGS